jgi:hypothetical protein
MEIKGTIKSIGETKQVTDKFSKREIIIGMELESKYPNYLKLEFNQDKCALLDSYKVGQEVTIGINLKGRLWTGNDGVETCYNTIQGWSIKSDTVNSTPKFEPSGHVIDDSQDLPF